MISTSKEIEEAWDEAEELNCSLRELGDDDLVTCRQALIERTKKNYGSFK